MEELILHSGRKLVGVHAEATCLGDHCAIHRPSKHPLSTAPLDWLDGVGLFRVCEHDYWHPDPDDVRFKIGTMQWGMVEAITSVHLMKENCDGCCQTRNGD